MFTSPFHGRQDTVAQARRAGSWSRQQARRVHLQFVRDAWRPILLLVLLGAVLMGITAVATSNKWQAFISGAALASLFWYLALVVVQVTGTTRFMVGEQGEEWTAEELRKLPRKYWRVIDHVPLRQGEGDIDHVLVGPAGAFAIETKATTKEWNSERPDEWLHRHSHQARRNAERAQMLLRAKGSDVRTDVTPVLALWGRMTGDTREVNGVAVVHGTDLRKWLAERRQGVLTEDEVERAAQGLTRYVESRENYILRTQGKLPLLVSIGPFGILSRVTTVVMGALLGFIAVSGMATVVKGNGLYATIAVSAILGLGGMSFPRLRLLATGWLGSAAALALLLLGLWIAYWL